MTPLAGRLLVATPDLRDPNFNRTVVHVLAHDDNGAFGLVLNRPSHMSVGEVLEPWADQVGGPSVLFIGGPVQPDGVIGLARTSGSGDGFVPLRGELGTVDLDLRPENLPRLYRLRLFAGYSGWSKGQLEAEVAMGGWIVLDADDDDTFSTEPTTLWRRVLARQPGELAWLASVPDDGPTCN
jgi:putative transcriptional regulator